MDTRFDEAEWFSDVNFCNIWDTINDQDLMDQLEAVESQLTQPQAVAQAESSAPVALPIGPTVLPNITVPGPATSMAKKRRFASLSEVDLLALEQDKHEKKTLDSTVWAVRLFKGKHAICIKAFKFHNKIIFPTKY